MACFSPITGYRSFVKNSKGKRSITFNKAQGFHDLPIKIACGQCIGCRLEKSRQWAIRCAHEAQMYDDNCFITLTYNDEHLPKNGSLNMKHFQDFMKRLRKKFGNNIRFFHCGEYGEKHKRPHYHACIFNFDFKDKELFQTRDGIKLYTSKDLEQLWPFGFCTIGDVTFESAAYVARYITKKITGPMAKDHYMDYSKETGEIYSERRPEYTTMSRRPGIGKPWLEKFLSDVYPSDFIIINGKKMRPPKYYDTQFEHVYPSDLEYIKEKRIDNSLKHADNNTRERLEVREKIQKLKFEQLKRGYESET